MKLYHGTSVTGLKGILKKKVIGLRGEDYRPFLQQIFEATKIDPAKATSWVNREVQAMEEYAPNGSVSFFPTFKHTRYWSILGKIQGEAFGHTLKRAIKYAARVNHVRMEQYLPLLKSYNKDYPVVLVVEVPVDLLENPHNRGEVISFGPIPQRYIKRLIFLDDEGNIIHRRRL